MSIPLLVLFHNEKTGLFGQQVDCQVKYQNLHGAFCLMLHFMILTSSAV